MNELYVEVAFDSLNKKNEELCGDKVEVFQEQGRSLIVLADGLGSGVKANILATLTSKIAITMLRKGASLFDVIETLLHTLPVCKVRHIAYATFTIIEIDDGLHCRIFESENPPYFFVRGGRLLEPKKQLKKIHDKEVMISEMTLQEDDTLYICSDGVVHAGVGQILNYGWQWPNVATYLENQKVGHAHQGCRGLLEACYDLYQGMPGDDTTVVTLKIRRPINLLLFTGPPVTKMADEPFVKKFLRSEGKKVICGGTAANIVSRISGRPIESSLHYSDPSLPPTGSIKGIDLVTEGVLTLERAIKIIEDFRKSPQSVSLDKDDGGSQLARIFIEGSTHIDVWLGRAINEAHQGPGFPKELRRKEEVVLRLIDVLKQLGRVVKLHYISEVDYEEV